MFGREALCEKLTAGVGLLRFLPLSWPERSQIRITLTVVTRFCFSFYLSLFSFFLPSFPFSSFFSSFFLFNL